jgi:hypothetical protein
MGTHNLFVQKLAVALSLRIRQHAVSKWVNKVRARCSNGNFELNNLS